MGRRPMTLPVEIWERSKMNCHLDRTLLFEGLDCALAQELFGSLDEASVGGNS
jgi:hypothetical protein